MDSNSIRKKTTEKRLHSAQYDINNKYKQYRADGEMEKLIIVCFINIMNAGHRISRVVGKHSWFPEIQDAKTIF